jgi:hypothetical protein
MKKTINFTICIFFFCRPWWSHGLRRGFEAAFLLGLRVRISPGRGCLSSECCVLSGRGFCEDRSLVQRSPTECGVPECVLETSTMRRTRATRADEPCEGGWC